ncbi:hypothetical protein [Actinorhabdospora filicis]|uniref:hypothetical protein n=1 Tax=Actinorhabdospora filicis TaxID=1785913 RepID=UPI002555ECD6|nr:hypothetical protein [Actinorhabdospora filicis]
MTTADPRPHLSEHRGHGLAAEPVEVAVAGIAARGDRRVEAVRRSVAYPERQGLSR